MPNSEVDVRCAEVLRGELTADDLAGVAEVKRFLERWTMDAEFRENFAATPDDAMASLRLSLSSNAMRALIEREPLALMSDGRGVDASDDPPCVQNYRAFCRDKMGHHRERRDACRSSHSRFERWRGRQAQRLRGELGTARADDLLQVPAAFELTRGCSVGCWFCGVDAPKLDTIFRYDARSWRSTLEVLRDVVGDGAQESFLYWATDPLDNPHYESFLADFHRILGRCPQTTTALATRDVARTRRLLSASRMMGCAVNRFSVLSIDVLKRLHREFTPQELLHVDCIPLNKEAGLPKAYAGRARRHGARRAAELTPPDAPATIATVCGFLFNMVDRSVQLVAPCRASDRWPSGYRVFDQGRFDAADDLRGLLDAMIERSMPPALPIDRVLRLRPDVVVEDIEDGIRLRAPGLATTWRHWPLLQPLGDRLATGLYTAEALASHRQRDHGIPMAETFQLLNKMFDMAIFEEDPIY